MLATSSPRAIESEALIRINAELKRSYARRETDLPAFVAALSRNLALWNHFASAAASCESGLPQETRNGIIRISVFVRSETLRLQRSRYETGVDALIEINANIAAGLRQPARGGGAA
jgi:flagellar biosynthesis activator protein FlaF